MFEKDRSLAVLYDLYGSLLSPAQQKLFEAYYGEDLSLAEIAGETGVSRQAVRSALARASGELRRFEDALGLWRKNEKWKELCDAASNEADAAKREAILAQIRGIL